MRSIPDAHQGGQSRLPGWLANTPTEELQMQLPLTTQTMIFVGSYSKPVHGLTGNPQNNHGLGS